MIIVLGIEKRKERRGEERSRGGEGKSALTLAANEAQTIEVGGGMKEGRETRRVNTTPIMKIPQLNNRLSNSYLMV